MIAEVAAQVPDSLAAYRDGVADGPGGPGALPLGALRDPRVFDATLAAFAAGLSPEAACATCDRRILVSYWSQFYLAALATPALTALVRLGRPLPLAFDTMSLERDGAGRPCRFRLPAEGCGSCPAPGLAGLVEAHLRPFVELCHEQCGIAPRILWGNAAVILDYVARELEGSLGDGEGAACDDVADCLGWRAGPACARSPLSQALCPGASGCRRRRVCCLRHRLPGVPSCGALCPVACAQT
ncbi:ferric iron reductase protein FhuF [Methylobacterium phyllostachyos]|uniref:Ferric iron reductase protein FhuF n=1 Tax=Methylobacterium phyllostachyos TaxID=582672 RepID=A0A1H0DJE1_9HYPH|nr:siderophore-iron reductase FhuF [Methylobacterium phyllostachyos]SDN70285.1 ferric iron reductase protein FhuF [Methylobacterium phyllostachyos]